jgi:hypothetical protein
MPGGNAGSIRERLTSDPKRFTTKTSKPNTLPSKNALTSVTASKIKEYNNGIITR